jgi:transcriptional regulator with XRE-family HTH domain
MTAERKSVDIGARLREARERKGLSLRYVADVTRISVRQLEALERNDISRLPGGIFSRAFVRSYALEVDLDPEALVEDFIKQFPHETVTAGHRPAAVFEDGDSFESDRRMALVTLRLLAIGVPIAALLIYFSIRGRGAPVVATGPVAVAHVTDANVKEAPSTERLVIGIVAARATRVVAAVDGAPEVSLELVAGDRRTFDAARQFSMAIDDSSAIDWTINGAAARPLGPSGERAAVQLTLDNYRVYLDRR